jgi:hypothetical protein
MSQNGRRTRALLACTGGGFQAADAVKISPSEASPRIARQTNRFEADQMSLLWLLKIRVVKRQRQGPCPMILIPLTQTWYREHIYQRIRRIVSYCYSRELHPFDAERCQKRLFE